MVPFSASKILKGRYAERTGGKNHLMSHQLQRTYSCEQMLKLFKQGPGPRRSIKKKKITRFNPRNILGSENDSHNKAE